MYVAIPQPARRCTRRRRRTLGDASSFWANITELFTGNIPDVAWNPVQNAASYYYDVATGQPVTPAPSANAQATSDSSFIPGSSAIDYLENAITGQPTQNQIAVNTNACVQAVGNMPGLTPAQMAAAIASCQSDQNAYVNLIGGTAEQTLNPVPGSLTMWAWIILGSVGALIFLMRR